MTKKAENLPIDQIVADYLLTDKKPTKNKGHTPETRAKISASLRGHTRGGMAIKLPSVLVPGEFNYMINPEHPDFVNKVKIEGPEPFYSSSFLPN